MISVSPLPADGRIAPKSTTEWKDFSVQSGAAAAGPPHSPASKGNPNGRTARKTEERVGFDTMDSLRDQDWQTAFTASNGRLRSDFVGNSYFSRQRLVSSSLTCNSEADALLRNTMPSPTEVVTY